MAIIPDNENVGIISLLIFLLTGLSGVFYKLYLSKEKIQKDFRDYIEKSKDDGIETLEKTLSALSSFQNIINESTLSSNKELVSKIEQVKSEIINKLEKLHDRVG